MHFLVIARSPEYSGLPAMTLLGCLDNYYLLILSTNLMKNLEQEKISDFSANEVAGKRPNICGRSFLQFSRLVFASGNFSAFDVGFIHYCRHQRGIVKKS